MKKILLPFVAACFSLCAFSQVQHLKVIRSLSWAYSGNILDSELPIIQLEGLNLQVLKDFAQTEALKNKESYYGKEIPYNINIKDIAFSEEIADGKLFRLKFVLPQATGMQFFFDRFQIPAGGSLFFYNPAKTVRKGAYTEKNNRPENNFATSIIKGDTIILEYFEPLNTAGELHLESMVFCFDYPVGVSESNRGPYGNSASLCEVNSTCAQGEGWEDERAAVGLILFTNTKNNLTAWGTGALLNTRSKAESKEGRYFVTAEHLEKIKDPNNADYVAATYYYKWTFMFHFEASSCSAPNATAPDNYTLSGCVKYTNSESYPVSTDLMLLHLIEEIPNDYKLCYAGWDKSGNTPSSTVGLHHPQGDFMKISVETRPAQTYPTQDYWMVDFADFNVPGNIGTTEPASSGSPLFNADHRFIGQLFGTNQNPADGKEFPVCDPRHQAWYGKFSRSMQNIPDLYLYLDPTNIHVTTDAYCPYRDDATASGDGGPGDDGSGYEPGGYSSDGVDFDNQEYPNDGCSNCLMNGFTVNQKAPNSGTIFTCPNSPIRLTKCVFFPVGLAVPPSCGFFDQLDGCDEVAAYKYYVSFYELNDDQSRTGHDEIQKNYTLFFGTTPALNYDIKQYAKEAGFQIPIGKFWRFKIGGNAEKYTQFCQTPVYQEWDRILYTIPQHKVVENISSLNYDYLAKQTVELKNVSQSPSEKATARAGESITFSPGTTLAGNFETYLETIPCDGGDARRELKKQITYIQVPSDNIPEVKKTESKFFKNLITVYPNPISDVLNVSYSPEKTMGIDILDILGGKVSSIRTNPSGFSTLSMEDFSRGVYILSITDRTGEKMNIRLVKK